MCIFGAGLPGVFGLPKSPKSNLDRLNHAMQTGCPLAWDLIVLISVTPLIQAFVDDWIVDGGGGGAR